MSEVYPRSNHGHGLANVLAAIIKASTLHVGAAAGAAALRDELNRAQVLSESEFNECFAVARLTPWTTLLALQTLVGYRVAGWRGALIALSLGAALPALIGLAVVGVYVLFSTSAVVDALMNGAQAGALAVFVWAAIRLTRPVVLHERVRAVILALAVAIVVALDLLPPFALLIASGAVSAFAFRGDE